MCPAFRDRSCIFNHHLLYCNVVLIGQLLLQFGALLFGPACIPVCFPVIIIAVKVP